MMLLDIKNSCLYYVSNYMLSHAIHTIQASIKSISCKSYTPCQHKIAKANQIRGLLNQKTLTNGQIAKLLAEFISIETPILHIWDSQGITILDLITKEIKTYPLLINSLSESITLDGRVFIFNAKLKGEFHEFDFDHCKLMSRQSTRSAKFAMGICECDQYIYSVGGKINKKMKSDIRKNTM